MFEKIHRLRWSLGMLVGVCFFSACAMVRYSPNGDGAGSVKEGHLNPSCGSEIPARNLPAGLEQSEDPDMAVLGRGLSGLPDLRDGLSDREAAALEKIAVWARNSRPEEREWLRDEAGRRKGPGGYSAALEGLLWMAEAGRIGPETRVRDREEVIRQAWSLLPARYPEPHAVLDYLAGHYTYTLDLTSAKRLEEFFRTKEGDCTEFSLLAGDLLQGLGFSVWVLTVRPTRLVNHVAVVYQDQDGFWLMDASRVAVSRVLRRKKKESGFWGPIDAWFWGITGDFEGVFGPRQTPEELVGLYGRSSGRAIPFRLIPFQEYRSHIQAYGQEAPKWYRFDQKR